VRSSSVCRFARPGRRVEPLGRHVGLPRRPSCEDSRTPESPLSRHSVASRRPGLWPCAHRRRTVPAPLGCGAEPRRQCDLACGSRAHRAPTRPTSQTHLVHMRRDRSSRFLQPSLPETRHEPCWWARPRRSTARGQVFAPPIRGHSDWPLCPELCPLDRRKHCNFLNISSKADSEKPPPSKRSNRVRASAVFA